jgi:hypothetical protein
LTLDAALAGIARTAARLCKANDAVIFLSDGTHLRAVTWGASSNAAPPRVDVAIKRANAIGRAFVERRSVHVRDLRVPPDLPDAASKRASVASPVRTQLSAPLIRNGDALGVLVARRTAVQPFTAHEIAVLETLAAHAAVPGRERATDGASRRDDDGPESRGRPRRGPASASRRPRRSCVSSAARPTTSSPSSRRSPGTQCASVAPDSARCCAPTRWPPRARATIGAIGFEGRWDYGAIGTVTNLASRLCGEAKAGQVLITSRVAAAVEGIVAAEEVGALTLKGFARPVPTLSITNLRA